MKGKLNGLDLFSGIGGITSALADWIRPIAYCENDRHAQSVLLSRMSTGHLHRSPIWDDVCTLQGGMLPTIDIIYGGFPCQDISVAGLGKGLEGKRSSLVFEIFRLAKEIQPRFIFLENVPAIRTRGGERVVKELATIGYDCRWDCLSAFDVGAPHKRDRWFLLAHRNGDRREEFTERDGEGTESGWTFWDHADRLCDAVSNTRSNGIRKQSRRRGGKDWEDTPLFRHDGPRESLANAESIGRREGRAESTRQQGRSCASSGGTNVADTEGSGQQSVRDAGDASLQRKDGAEDSYNRGSESGTHEPFDAGWWSVEPNVGRVVNGLPLRVDRLRGLGNAVVPAQAREAFKRLMGL